MEGVSLCIYDLTGGMARALSASIIGKQIDGIYHTSVVAFGREFFYGGGICIENINTTPYGTPVQTMPMGSTEKSRSEFDRFLSTINHKFTFESYHLINHNCNHFTEECCRFLVGKSLPNYIINQHEELLSTPIGKSFEPMINSMMNMTGTSTVQPLNIHNEHITHQDLFSKCKKIELFAELDEYTKKGGMVVFWDPSNESCFEIAEDVNAMCEITQIACVDCLRNWYLKPQTVPSYFVYVEGEVVSELTTNEELQGSKELMTDLFSG